VDNENNVYVTGGFEGTKTFGTTNLTSFGSSDIYVVKYDNSGSFIFAKQAGSPLEDRGNDIAFDHKDHLYITGEFKAKAAFDTDTINNYGSDEDRDIFVARMSKTGVWDWAKKAGSKGGGDRGNGIVVNNSGNIFVTGQFKDSAKFGGSLEINAGIDSIQVFVAAIDSLGKWRWVMQGGGPDSDRGNGISCDNNCNVYVDGYYSSTVLFNTNTITSTGGKDAFTLKIQNACFTYDSPVPPPPPDIISGISPSNVFSPNDDGVNDVFKIASQSMALLNCKIYDRWGILVEELSKLNEGWDGRSTSGLECSVGVYYYVIAAKDTNGKDFNEKGFLQLLR
jgi:gliding motility-associated-like protein